MESPLRRMLRRFSIERSANVATLFALFLPVLIGCAALAVDYGNLTLQDRKLQKAADLASIIAAANIEDPERAVAKFFSLNGHDIAVETERGLLLGDRFYSNAEYIDQQRHGIASLVRGRYFPDPKMSTDRRFVEGESSPDAARVTIRKRGEIYFGKMFTDPPELSAVGTASAEKLAGFSIGSRLASLNDGILNAILGELLGTDISLKAMDYESLLDTDIEVLSFIAALSTRLDVTALTYDKLFAQDLTLPQILSTLRLTSGVPPAARSALKKLETATSGADSTIRLERIVNLGSRGSMTLATDAPWDMKIGAMELIVAAAALANGDDYISLDTGIKLPPLANVHLKLAIGEPPAATPAHALAPIGATVRTAQTRLKLSFEVGLNLVVLKTKLHVPLYVEVAHAEARLSDIQCSRVDGGGSAIVDAMPGVVEIAVGEVDDRILTTFSDDARVTPAKLVDVRGPLTVSAEGMTHAETQNMEPDRLRFSTSDIQRGHIRTVSTRHLLGSTTSSLFSDLDLDVKVEGDTLLGGTLLNKALVKSTVKAALAGLARPIDEILFNVLALAGIRIGEADVRVTGVNCQRPVLVQ